MSDLFFWRDALEPESQTEPIQRAGGGGSGEQTDPGVDDYHVQAKDGPIGTVADTTAVAGESYIIVHTRGGVLGHKVLIPAGMVERIDRDRRTVHLDRSREEIRKAPEFDEGRYRDPSYREELARHYSG